MPRTRALLLLVLLAAVGGGGFFLLRGFDVAGGDTPALLDLDNPAYALRWDRPWVFNDREPLAHLLVQQTYRATGNLPFAFSLVSSVCGGAWLVVLTLFRRTWRFWPVVLLNVLFLEFMGHKEFYAPVLLALTVYFLLLWRAGRGPAAVPLWAAILVFGVAALTHKLAFFYLPAMAALAIDPKTRTLRRLPRTEIERALLAVIGVSVVMQAPIWLKLFGLPHLIVLEYDNRILELLTLPKPWADAVAARSLTGAFQLFYFGSADHFLYFLGFWAIGAPVAIPILIWKRRRLLEPEYFALTLGVGCSLVWTFLWHPHMGWADWDLFCAAALPANILASLLVSRPRSP